MQTKYIEDSKLEAALTFLRSTDLGAGFEALDSIDLVLERELERRTENRGRALQVRNNRKAALNELKELKAKQEQPAATGKGKGRRNKDTTQQAQA